MDFPRENFSKKFLAHKKYFLDLSQNNFAGNFSRDFHKKFSRHTRQSPGSRFSQNTASHLSPDSCIHSPPHAADPESKLVSANSLLRIHLNQRLVGIHSRKVCRDVIAMCSSSAGIKSGHSGQIRPCFRKLLHENYTKKRSRK